MEQVSSWTFATEFFYRLDVMYYELRVNIIPPGCTYTDTEFFSYCVSDQMIEHYYEYVWKMAIQAIVKNIEIHMNTPWDVNDAIEAQLMIDIKAGPSMPIKIERRKPDDTYRKNAASEFEGVEPLDESLWWDNGQGTI